VKNKCRKWVQDTECQDLQWHASGNSRGDGSPANRAMWGSCHGM